MKRTLLLIPILLIALVACREKKLTSNPPPPDAPNSNGQGSETLSGNYPPVEEDSVVIEHITVEINTTTTTSNGVTTTTSDTVVTSVVLPTDTLCRLMVSFVSKGGGINHDAMKGFDKWLAQDVRGGYTFTKKSWGREGEINYCFNLGAMSGINQETFAKDVRKYLDGKENVIVSEYVECKGNALTGETTPPVEEVEVVKDSNIVRLVVSFISKGQGTDGQAKEDFEKWLGERPQYTYEKTSWGREGEMNYCFRLSNIDGRQQEVFIRDVRTFFSGKDLVIVSEWSACDKRK